MKTARSIAAIAKATRELEKRVKKSAPGPEFAQVLVAATAPLPVVATPSKPVSPAAQARAVEQIALHAKKPLPVPATKPKAERMPEKIELPAAPAPVAATASRATAEPPPASFVAALPEDPALRLTVNPNVAAIQVQTPDAGDLSLYLRVRQGAAELRVEGGAAPQLERRVDELRMVLAAEGISLKHVEVTPPAEAQQTASFSSDSEHGQRHAPPEPFEAPDPAAATAPKSTPSTPARVEAGLHVRA